MVKSSINCNWSRQFACLVGKGVATSGGTRSAGWDVGAIKCGSGEGVTEIPPAWQPVTSQTKINNMPTGQISGGFLFITIRFWKVCFLYRKFRLGLIHNQSLDGVFDFKRDIRIFLEVTLGILAPLCDSQIITIIIE